MRPDSVQGLCPTVIIGKKTTRKQIIFLTLGKWCSTVCQTAIIAPIYTKVWNGDSSGICPFFLLLIRFFGIYCLFCFLLFCGIFHKFYFPSVPHSISIIIKSVDHRAASTTPDWRQESLGGWNPTNRTSAKQNGRQHPPNPAKGGGKTSLPPRPDLRPKQSMAPAAILVLNLSTINNRAYGWQELDGKKQHHDFWWDKEFSWDNWEYECIHRRKGDNPVWRKCNNPKYLWRFGRWSVHTVLAHLLPTPRWGKAWCHPKDPTHKVARLGDSTWPADDQAPKNCAKWPDHKTAQLGDSRWPAAKMAGMDKSEWSAWTRDRREPKERRCHRKNYTEESFHKRLLWRSRKGKTYRSKSNATLVEFWIFVYRAFIPISWQSVALCSDEEAGRRASHLLLLLLQGPGPASGRRRGGGRVQSCRRSEGNKGEAQQENSTI